MDLIKNEADLLEYLEADTRERAKRNLYKYSDCGAWIAFDDDGIRLGSIVEGADFGTAIYRLDYPFTPTEYGERLTAIEEEADLIWHWANDDDPDFAGLDAPEYESEFETDGRSA